MKRGWDSRTRSAQHGRDDGGQIETPLTDGAGDAGEHLLRIRAAPRAVASTDFPSHDRGTNRLLSTPVRRVDARLPQKGEDRVELGGEMGGEALRRGQPGHGVNQVGQARVEAAARHGEAVRGDLVGVPPVPERQPVEQDLLHRRGPRAPWMILLQRARAAKQVRDARLVQRRGELPIRRPAVTDQYAVEARIEDRGRVLEAPPRTNGVDRRVWRGEDPQPVEHRADAPTRFVGTDHGTPAHLFAEGRIGWGRPTRRPMKYLRQAAGRDRQPKAIAEYRRDFFQGDAELGVHQHDERDRPWPQVHVRGTQRIGGLQGMPALHAPATLAATTHLHIELSDDRSHDREIFLILGGDAGELDGAATVRARRWQRGGVGLIDAGRPWSSPATAIRGTGAPARTSAATLGPVFREGGRLTEAGAPGRIELLLETFVLALQPIAFTLDVAPSSFRARHVVAQPRDLTLLTLNQIVAIIAGRALARHACVMSYPRNLYKYKLLDLAFPHGRMR